MLRKIFIIMLTTWSVYVHSSAYENPLTPSSSVHSPWSLVRIVKVALGVAVCLFPSSDAREPYVLPDEIHYAPVSAFPGATRRSSWLDTAPRWEEEALYSCTSFYKAKGILYSSPLELWGNLEDCKNELTVKSLQIASEGEGSNAAVAKYLLAPYVYHGTKKRRDGSRLIYSSEEEALSLYQSAAKEGLVEAQEFLERYPGDEKRD